MAQQVSGIAELIAKMTRLELDMRAGARASVAAACHAAASVADPLTPVKTGQLKSRNQIREVENGPSRFVGEFFNDTDYALPVARGHHTSSGSWVRPQDFMTPAFIVGRRTLLDRMRSIL